ncbi:MAG: putative porin, partial [Sulfurimonas sp.]
NVAAFRVAGTRSRLDILTAPIVAGGEYEESNQFAIDLKYKFNFGLLLDIRHLNVDYKAKADEANFSIFMARYAFKKSLKGLSVVFIYEDENHSLSANDDKTSWLRTSFKF